jgi:class 3 adenylate cyclase
VTATIDDRLAAGRAAFERHAWADAYAALRAVDAESPLGGEDLERLAEAARWSHHFPEMLDAFERAEGVFARTGDRRGAARVALHLTWEHYQRGDDAQTTGWVGRAASHLEGDTGCAEYGRLLMLSGISTVLDGDLESGRDLLQQAREVARGVGDADVEGLCRIYLGHALVNLGETAAGLAMVDEATAAAMSGTLGVQAAGSIYCSTIFLCRNRGDWRRASEWTDASLRWCERESVSGFPGLCRFHHAEVMRFRGALEEAEQDALEAIEELTASAPRWAAWAFHELGEIRRRRGDLRGAVDAFRQASELGFDPQPGFALLRLDEGDVVTAQRAIRRAVADEAMLSRESLGLVLPAQVTIELAADDLDAARGAYAALEARAEQSASTAFAAAAATARGELALAEGRPEDASRELRRAWQGWREVDAPYEGAQTRLLLARAYQGEGDEAAARQELEGAQSAFRRIGAVREAERVAGLLETPRSESRAVRTFVFTDIVDSTRLVEALGDEAWEGLLGWHDRTLRACFDAHGGDEVKHEGDGFFVVFPDTRRAIDGACAIQRSLAQHRRDHGFAPQVRIGVHTAEVTERSGDFVGKGVHAAARIGAAAMGGEILASRAVIEGAGDGIMVSNERSLELKGLADPVRVASVDWSA